MVIAEEEVLGLVTYAYQALSNSTTPWSTNYWTTVLKRLEVRYPYYGEFESN